MNTTIPVNAEILLDGSQLTLGEAIVTAQDWLTAFANSETFLPTVNLTFGNQFDVGKVTKLRQEWAAKDFKSLPTIEIRTATELNGANGAFAAATNTIYLSQDYIVENSDNPQGIVEVLLEEIGHAVDAQINLTDAPGDEGAIFSTLVQGKDLSSQQLSVLKFENDQAIINLDGEKIEIEKSDQGVITDLQGRGTAFRLDDIPIFVTTPEEAALKDLDKDGLNDEWENIAVQSLRPTLVFAEGEELFKNPDHKVALFTRVTPVEVEEDGIRSTYIVFLNSAAYTKDYGTPDARAGDHNGDVSKFNTAWKVADDESTIKLDRLWTSGHVGLDRHHETFEVSVENTENPGINFAADGSLKIYIEEDKHSTWSSPELHSQVDSVYPINSGFEIRPQLNSSQIIGSFNVGEPLFHPSPEFTNNLNALFDGERVWNDPDGWFSGGLERSTDTTGNWLGGLIGAGVGFIVGGIILGPVGAIGGAIGAGIGGAKLGKAIEGASPGYIGSGLGDSAIDELFPNNLKKGSDFYLDDVDIIGLAEINVTINQLDAIDDVDDYKPNRGDFYYVINIDGEEYRNRDNTITQKSHDPIETNWNPITHGTNSKVFNIDIDIREKDGGGLGLIDFDRDDHPDIYQNPNNPKQKGLKLSYDLLTGEVKDVLAQDPGQGFGPSLVPLGNNQFYSQGDFGSDKVGIWFTIQTEFAAIYPDGTLRIDDNIAGRKTDEYVEVKHISGQAANEVIEIEANGIKQLYGVGTSRGAFTQIEAFGGDGNDTIILDGIQTSALIGGGDGNDKIEIINSPNGTSDGSTFYGDDGNDTLRGGSGNDRIYGGSGEDELFGGSGNDHITGGGNDDIIDGGDGDDILSGDSGNPGQDQINGGDGDDVIGGGGKADYIDGGDGDDVILGDSSFDEINFMTFAPIAQQLGDTILGGLGDDAIFGEGGDDRIYGDSGKDWLFGGIGNDTIDGGSNNDTIEGNNGDDTLSGDSGNDVIYGDTQFNDISANSVNPIDSSDKDTIKGGLGDDSLYGGTDNDFLMGEAGNDLIDGGEGIDTVSYENSPNGVIVNSDEVLGYSNPDNTLPIALEPNFTIQSGTAADGFGSTDTLKNLENIIGSPFDDVIIGNLQANSIQSLDGNDLLIGNSGNDTIDGGAGIDTISYHYDPSAVTVNLAENKATDGYGSTDTFLNIENIIGSALDDQITGDSQANHITAGAGKDSIKGGAGDDQLYGEAGDDFLMGEAGNDVLDGGDDIDTVSFSNSLSSVVINLDEINSYSNPGGSLHTTILSTTPIPTDIEPEFTINPGTASDGFGTTDTLRNIENILASQSDDVIIGNAENNHLEGLGGNDVLIGNSGNDILDGGVGLDTISYRRDPNAVTVNLEQGIATDGWGNNDQIYSVENVIGSNSNDRVIGDANANTIITGTGDDWVEARNGDDIIFGEQGQDTLFAENGNDFLVGGEDADSLNGGEGNDTASYFTAASRVAVSLTTGKGWVGDAKGDRIEAIENLEGSDYEDLLIGNSINNTLSGLGGDDLIYAKAGDDILDGGDGSDRLIAGDGNDTLYGQAGEDLLKGQNGDDLLNGGDGNDQLYGHKGNDTLDGNAGNDYLEAGNGNDYLKGSQGNDQLYSQKGEDTLEGGTGDDLLDGGNSDDILSGGDGDDQLYGQNGSDTLNGNTGNDYLDGGNGNDQLTGEDGNDRLYGDNGNDTLNGNAGNDLLDGGKGHDQLTGGDGNDQLYGQQGKDTLEGETGNDSLWGGDHNDILLGQAGNDYLDGGKGDDQLDGGEGKDRLYGQNGEDILKGGTGDDYLDGGSDNDELYGNQGNDRIYGQQGHDTLDGEDGHDFLDGGLGDDFIYGKQGSDRLYGQQGQDYLDGGIGDDRLEAGDGDDQLYGQQGRDYLDGGAGDDFLWGGDDADKLLGQSGNDYLDAGSGHDQLIGGDGNDQLYGQDGDDTLNAGVGNDYLEGGLGNDQLTGGDGNDYLYGQDGEDILNGDAGNDNLYGGANNDQLSGGDGNDLLYGEDGNDNLDAGAGDDYLEGGFGDDQLIGGDGNDQLYGQDGDDTIDAGVGNDYLEGGFGDDQLTGGLGDDYLQGQEGNDTIDAGAGNDYLVGGNGIDILFGQAGDDYLEGGDGDDTLYGNTGNDELIGGNGNDQLYAGAGDNILNGGLGQDLLYSGTGRDMFVLEAGMGEDTIFDFTVGFDYLGLANGLTFEDLTITQGSGNNAENTEIHIQESEELLTSLVGVQADTLSFWDFAVI